MAKRTGPVNALGFVGSASSSRSASVGKRRSTRSHRKPRSALSTSSESRSCREGIKQNNSCASTEESEDKTSTSEERRRSKRKPKAAVRVKRARKKLRKKKIGDDGVSARVKRLERAHGSELLKSKPKLRQQPSSEKPSLEQSSLQAQPLQAQPLQAQPLERPLQAQPLEQPLQAQPLEQPPQAPMQQQPLQEQPLQVQPLQDAVPFAVPPRPTALRKPSKSASKERALTGDQTDASLASLPKSIPSTTVFNILVTEPTDIPVPTKTGSGDTLSDPPKGDAAAPGVRRPRWWRPGLRRQPQQQRLGPVPKKQQEERSKTNPVLQNLKAMRRELRSEKQALTRAVKRDDECDEKKLEKELVAFARELKPRFRALGARLLESQKERLTKRKDLKVLSKRHSEMQWALAKVLGWEPRRSVLRRSMPSASSAPASTATSGAADRSDKAGDVDGSDDDVVVELSNEPEPAEKAASNPMQAFASPRFVEEHREEELRASLLEKAVRFG